MNADVSSEQNMGQPTVRPTTAKLASNPPQHKLVLSYDEDTRTPLLDGLVSLANYWKAVAATSLLGALVGLALCFILPRQYVVSSLYAFAGDAQAAGGMGGIQARLGGLASLAGMDLSSSGSSRAEIITTLQSEPFVQGFIRDEHLLPVLFANKWNAATKSWKPEVDDIPTLSDGFERFTRTVLSLSEDKANGIVRLKVVWTDPQQAVQWSNRLIARLNALMRQDAKARADTSLQYLATELESTASMELRQALYGLIESAAQKKLLASVTSEYALRAIAVPIAPDADKFTSPRKPKLMLTGAFAGLIFASAIVAIRLMLRRY